MSDAANVVYAVATNRAQSDALPALLSGKGSIVDVQAIPQCAPKAVEYKLLIDPAELGCVLFHLRASGFGLLGAVH